MHSPYCSQNSSFYFFLHLQTPLPTQIIPGKQTTSDPIKYHSRTTRQEGGVPSLPPRPPLISQSKYFSLFSNPDSCKNSSIIIILIIIYKNRSSFSFYFLSFSKCIFFFPKQRDLLFGNSVIYIFFFTECVIRKANPSPPSPRLPEPREEKRHVFVRDTKQKQC